MLGSLSEGFLKVWTSVAGSEYGVKTAQYLAPYKESAGRQWAVFMDSRFGIKATQLFAKTIEAGSFVAYSTAALIAEKFSRARPYFADASANRELAKQAFEKTDAKGFVALAVATYVTYRAVNWAFSRSDVKSQQP